MAQWGRRLDCLAAAEEAAIPVYAVRTLALTDFLESLAPRSAAFVRASGFTARAGSVALLPGGDGIGGAVLGLGEEAGPYPFGSLPFALPEGAACRLAGQIDCPEHAVLGFCLGAYRFDQLKSAPSRAPARLVPPVATAQAVSIAEAAWLVRDLINLPANLLGPAELAEAATHALREAGADVTLVEDAALQQNYPLVACVGAGSARAPRVVKAIWSPDNPTHSKKLPLVSLCGKGVCFDTGGYDLKQPASMLRMKKDMGGAAVALAVALLVIRARLDVRLELRLGCVENSISGQAMRPLDIVRSRRGLSVAVGNTDAEGRLVLADLLAEASDAGPDLLFDFATLTGAARVALGPDLVALFCNDDTLAGTIETEARRSHDPVWRLPLWNSYYSMLEASGADLNNVSEKSHAGAILAALFLQRFLAPGIHWAHFDLYGWNDSARPGRPEGGEAHAMRAAFAAISRLVSSGENVPLPASG